MQTDTRPRTFLVTRKQSYLKDFKAISPEIVTSARNACKWFLESGIDSLWLSYDEHIMDAALKNVWLHRKGPIGTFGMLILFYTPHVEDVPMLTSSFKRLAFFADDDLCLVKSLAKFWLQRIRRTSSSVEQFQRKPKRLRFVEETLIRLSCRSLHLNRRVTAWLRTSVNSRSQIMVTRSN